MVGTDRTTVIPVPVEPVVVMPRPLTMPCPTCGGDALWQWHMPVDRNGTVYPGVDCQACTAREVESNGRAPAPTDIGPERGPPGER